MKNQIIISAFALFLAIGILGFGENAKAAVNLPWSTTFDCPEWDLSNCAPNYYPSCTDPNCDSISRHLNSLCSGGQGEQITTVANMAAGGGGRGQRHWFGDGSNNESGNLSIAFNNEQSELWIRWYMRYQSGFAWDGTSSQGHKILYFDGGQPSSTIIGIRSTDGLRVRSHFAPMVYDPDTWGWNSMMVNGGTDGNGNKISDGAWHCWEVHLKMDTNGNDGVAEIWVDEVKVLDKPDCDFNTAGGWDWFLFPANGSHAANGQCETIDLDDIAISNTGYIGPLNSSDTNPPSRSNPQPTGTLSSGTTSTTISLDTDETAICKYDTASGVTFDQQQFTFDTTGSITHSQLITGLSNGDSKTYYVRCQDTAGNSNPDDNFTISFSIASSTTYSISNFINLVTDWLKTDTGLESDVNGDGIVNTRDLGIMMSNWQ